MTITSSLPILDLTDLDAEPSSAAAFRAALRAATHSLGFFYLRGTGVTPDLETRMLSAARALFALPESEKAAIEMVNSPHFRGFTRVGGERTRGKVDWREQIDIAREDPALPQAEWGQHTPLDRLRGPNQWPAGLPELRPVADEWISKLEAAARRLLQAWAEALGEDPGYFDKSFGDPFYLLKIVRYPGIVRDQSDQGVGAHKDAGCVTLLWIEPGSSGLQVELAQKDAPPVWIDAPPVPGAFVVNIGEMLEYATQGYLKATVHRVVSTERERISVPFFFNPALDARLPAMRILEGKGTGVSQDPNNPIHNLYGQNMLKSRLRAHVDVAARWHADLISPEDANKPGEAY